MTRVTPLVAWLPAVLLVNAVAAEAQEAESATWPVRIVRAGSPQQALVTPRSIYGGTDPARPQSPPDGQRWLIIGAVLTAPAGPATLSEREITVKADGTDHRLFAIATLPQTGEPSFLPLSESDGIVAIDENADARWVIRDGAITFERRVTDRVALAFLVPRHATTLRLQIGKSVSVPIRLP